MKGSKSMPSLPASSRLKMPAGSGKVATVKSAIKAKGKAIKQGGKGIAKKMGK